MPPIRLISFGYLHQPAGVDGAPIPPAADRIEDVRARLRDPAAAQGILDLDGRDARVQHIVFNTTGARELLLNLADYAELPAAPASIAIGCAGGKHRAAALVELLARMLRERGVREVEVEHRHAHLPRILTSAEDVNEPEPGGTVDALFELYDQFTALEQHDPDPGECARSGQELATVAQAAFAHRFAPYEAMTAPILEWVGYPEAERLRLAPHAVAHLGPGWFYGQQLYLAYQRDYDPDAGVWLDTFELLDSAEPDTVTVQDLSELTDALAEIRISYDDWCQDGADTIRAYDDFDPYEYSDPHGEH